MRAHTHTRTHTLSGLLRSVCRFTAVCEEIAGVLKNNSFSSCRFRDGLVPSQSGTRECDRTETFVPPPGPGPAASARPQEGPTRGPREPCVFIERARAAASTACSAARGALWLHATAVSVPTPALRGEDGAPVRLLVLADATHFPTFEVFLSFFVPCKGRGSGKKH